MGNFKTNTSACNSPHCNAVARLPESSYNADQFCRWGRTCLTLICPIILPLCIGLTVQTKLHAQTPKLFEVDVPGGHFVGLPVHWGRHDAVVLETSGRMQFLEQTDIQDHRTLAIDFQPQSVIESRLALQAELGARYETVIFGPYVIAAPIGQAQRWRDQFSSLLAGYVRYFEVRQWPLRRPDFPLCVVVYASRGEFVAYTNSQVQQLPSSVVGCYSPRSNRCALYNIDGPATVEGSATRDAPVNWNETQATIIHEAVHQLAYNTGLHERLSIDPLWFVEGLASMFEQPKVYDLKQHSTLVQRLLPDKCRRLQQLWQHPEQIVPLLEALVVSDDLFSKNPDVAYDFSWAMTFYLAERMPAELRQFTSLLSQRPFGDYPNALRMRDFKQAFGGDLSLLAGRMVRFYSE